MGGFWNKIFCSQCSVHKNRKLKTLMDLQKIQAILQKKQEPKKFHEWSYLIPVKELRPMLAKLHPVQGLPLAVEHSYQYVEGTHQGMPSGVNGQVVGHLILREATLINDLSPSSSGQWLSPEDPDPNVKETFNLIAKAMAADTDSDGTQELEEEVLETPIRPPTSKGQDGVRLKRARMVNFKGDE